MFDTKIAIVVRDDLATWQKQNVTAVLMSGITGANPELIGAPYKDRDSRDHLPMSVQPVIVLTGAANVLTSIRNRAHDRNVATVAYIEEMFGTGHDEANRAVFAETGGCCAGRTTQADTIPTAPQRTPPQVPAAALGILRATVAPVATTPWRDSWPRPARSPR